MTYVISDIHGNYDKFCEMLSKICFGDADTMYVLGDTVDFGEEPMKLIDDLSMRTNVFSVAGEHDYLAARMLHGFDKMLKTGATPEAGYISEMTQWVQDGGQTTLNGFRNLDAEQREGVLEYLEDMTLFEEVSVKGKKYLLLHAGIANFDADTDLEDYPPESFFSEALDSSYELIEGITIVVGHVPTKSGKIERGKGSIFINCGVSEGGKLACLCLESGEEFYV